MFDNFNPVAEWPLTVVTDRLIIQGTALTRVKRLTDLINDPNLDYLVLQDATFTEVGSHRVVVSGGMGQIRLSDVLLVHSTASTNSNSNMRMPKQPIKATLMIPPFTVEGTIYLPYESQIRVALDGYTEKFVPVTQARYWAASVDEAPVSVDLLVVNHARAHVSVAADVEWSGEQEPNVEEGGQNPW